MTPAGLAALKAELRLDEGCRLKAYPDPRSGGAPWTIGYGHTGPEVHPGLVWTQAQADAALVADVEQAERGLAKALPWLSRLDAARLDVLVDMAFNLGVSGLLAFHRTLSAVEDGAYGRAADCMLATQPWAREVGSRATRLASWMRDGRCPASS